MPLKNQDHDCQCLRAFSVLSHLPTRTPFGYEYSGVFSLWLKVFWFSVLWHDDRLVSRLMQDKVNFSSNHALVKFRLFVICSVICSVLFSFVQFYSVLFSCSVYCHLFICSTLLGRSID